MALQISRPLSAHAEITGPPSPWCPRAFWCEQHNGLVGVLPMPPTHGLVDQSHGRSRPCNSQPFFADGPGVLFERAGPRVGMAGPRLNLLGRGSEALKLFLAPAGGQRFRVGGLAD